MKDFFQFSRYLFVFAHPDDEIYTCAFIQKLTNERKRVDILYVTSGDYQGPEMIEVREEEVRESTQLLNVPVANVHFMRVPERQLMDKVNEVRENFLTQATKLSPDCIIGHDFEGGHNGHDAVSFCTSRVAEEVHIPLYVFPAYYGWPEKRIWNQFASHEATDTLTLTPDMKALQDRVIAIHASQAGFFNTIRQSSSNDLLSAREVLRLVTQPINYMEPPTVPVGYEYSGSKLRFDDFKTAIRTPRRILLLSSGRFLATNPKVFGKPFKDMRMVYITNAAKGVSNKEYVERRKQLFKEEGYNYIEFDLDGKNPEELQEALRGVEIIFVEGGNTFYLLKSVKESGFDKILPDLLDAGVIYMGSSAGSYIACPTIEMATWKHQDKYDRYGLTDFHALALVPFLVSVHYRDEYRELLIEKIKNCKLQVKILDDKQAILVQGNDARLIGEGEEINL